MERKELDRIVQEAIHDADLSSGEIPAIDLYVDQIINLVAEKQKEGSERFHDRLLTKTMINNYSKDGLIMPVKGKKYTREHIIQMLLVYSLKNTLSMTEIRRILCDVYDKQVPLVACYDAFIEGKPDDRALALDAVEEVISRHGYDMERDEDYFKALLELETLNKTFNSLISFFLANIIKVGKIVDILTTGKIFVKSIVVGNKTEIKLCLHRLLFYIIAANFNISVRLTSNISNI